jgi:hypothetical protein
MKRIFMESTTSVLLVFVFAPKLSRNQVIGVVLVDRVILAVEALAISATNRECHLPRNQAIGIVLVV